MELPLFSHTPLPDASTHIRLLEILHGFFNQEVICKLSTWELKTAPAYFAVSYTWGDPSVEAEITVNDQRMVVRKNCEYVLQQAFNSKASRYFWVDAVSIDQASTQEKNHQVALMGEIYKTAAHVFACVGPDGSDSQYLLEVIEKNEQLLSQIYRCTGTQLHAGDWEIANPIPKERSLSMKCSLMNLKGRKRLIIAFVAFMQRSYFTRVWVLQELHLASAVSYCCGKAVQAIDYILALDQLVDFWVYEQWIYYPSGWRCKIVSFFTSQGRKASRVHENDLVRIRPRQGCLVLATGARNTRHLIELLDAMQNFQCADPRDKLYGVLSLVEWNNVPGLVPDYGKESFDLATEVLRILLANLKYKGYYKGWIEWAQFLCELLEISHKQRACQLALSRRNGDREDLVNETNSRQNTASMLDLDWTGCQLVDEDSSLALAPASTEQESLQSHDSNSSSSGLRIRRPSSGRADGENVELVKNGTLFAYAPKDTQAGDWFLASTYNASWLGEKLAVIARTSGRDGSGNMECTLIGRTAKVPIRPTLDAKGWWGFSVRWHPEDLLFLSWASLNQPKTHSSDIDGWLRVRICGWHKSSCALRRT